MERNPKKQKNNPVEQQASTSTLPCLPYDIFLSFRGEDTRYTFIDHLKRELEGAGYRVFFDEEGIQLGTEIRSELPKAIQESKSSIVVLSQGYASSKWCLNELVLIMGRHTQDGHHVVPVFYHVDPSDVRHQKKSFANSFAEHQQASAEEEIAKKWKESLAKIGGLSGIVVGDKTSESKVIRKIVKKIGECIAGTAKYQFPTSELVGQGFKRARDEICSLLEKVDVEKIGVYGMGGVGKTTLMKHIYNQLQDRSDSFPPSYWVTVSQDFSIYKLQEGIAKAIKVDISKEDDILKRAAKLMGELNRKRKFILILDDLWVHFDTKDVGLPVGPNGCKLVFTTRSDEVCRKMGCKTNKVRVEPLSEEEAFDLFKKEIESIEIDDEALVKSVVKECAGLPLAIKVMAKSLQGVDDVGQWRYRFAQLRESKVTKDDDMEEQVFAVLRTSYASIKDPFLQECFLYCALFPEDFEIERNKLIVLLICERIIVEGESRQQEVDQGHYMLDKLVSLCLLEGSRKDVFNPEERSVKMHDLIRDVGLQELRKRSVVMVEAGKQLRALPDLGKWSIKLHRASFIHHDIKNIPSGHSPCCPHLSTLFLGWDEYPHTFWGNGLLNYIEDSFFEKLNGLKVLDLSYTGIKELPGSISDLVRLTGLFLAGCYELSYVPLLAKLQELKALDLYDTELKEVPNGMALLHNLRYLNIYSSGLKVFPDGILPNLSRLQFLGLHNWMVKGEEVGGLRNLEVLVCGFQEGFVGFNSYLQFQKHEKPLVIFKLLVNSGVGNTRRYPTGKSVSVWGCDISRQFDKLPRGIEELVLNRCKCPRSLLVPVSNATELKSIELLNCDVIEYLVSSSSSGSSVDVLNKLERLKLNCLESLWLLVDIKAPHQVMPSYGSIFIHLKELSVSRCHRIKKLFHWGLLQNLKNLENLTIQHCEGMEEIIASEESGPSYITSQISLPKLRRLHFCNLPQLTSICDGSLICQSLQEIKVLGCPMLKRIPIDPPLPSLREGVATD